MAVQVISKTFDANRAVEHITLQDSLGRKRVVSVNMNGEACPHCGNPLKPITPPTADKVQDAINANIAAMQEEETKLIAYKTARGYAVQSK